MGVVMRKILLVGMLVGIEWVVGFELDWELVRC